MDGMRHIIRLLNDRPEDFELKVKFSNILLNFSREIPNLKIGAIFSVFVKPFFYLLDIVITNELKLFLRNKRKFFERHLEDLKPNDDEDYPDIAKSEHGATSTYSPTKKHSEDGHRASHKPEHSRRFSEVMDKLEKAYKLSTPANKEDDKKSEKTDKSNSGSDKQYTKEMYRKYKKLEENVLNSLCIISLQRISQPLIFKSLRVKMLLDFIDLSIEELKIMDIINREIHFKDELFKSIYDRILK